MSFPGVSRGSLRWVGVTGALACTLVACVNRGRHAPELDADRDRGPDRDAAPDRTGNDGTQDRTSDGNNDGAQDRTSDGNKPDALVDTGGGAGGAGGAGVDASGDTRGVGGASPGTGGRGAGGTTGAGGSVMDAGPGDVPRVCSARFNFEGGNRHGAFINSGFQTAFSNLAIASDAACGSGSLRLDTTVSPTADKGEVIIPLGATEDVSGKTFSISVKSLPAAPPNAYIIVFLVPSYAYVTSFSPIPSVWTASTVTLPNGADAGTRATTAIAVQVLGRGDSYVGALTLDEIDLR